MDSGTRSTSEYKKIPLEEIFNLLKASADGLAGSEAGRRLEIFGYNEITEGKKSLLLRRDNRCGQHKPQDVSANADVGHK